MRPILPMQAVTAGYLTIENRGADTLRILGGSSEAFDAVELHEMVIDDQGVMKMRRLDRLDVAPGVTVRLEPGGRHLMLIGPKWKVSPGNDIPLVLRLQSGEGVAVAGRVTQR